MCLVLIFVQPNRVVDVLYSFLSEDKLYDLSLSQKRDFLRVASLISLLR